MYVKKCSSCETATYSFACADTHATLHQFLESLTVSYSTIATVTFLIKLIGSITLYTGVSDY